jgi:tRNA-binding protein
MAEEPVGETISYNDFFKVDVRVGTVVACEPFPEARRPAYKLKVDFGPGIGVKKTSAQITELYGTEEVVGRQVAAVVNFPPKQIGPFISEVLVLGFEDADGNVALITVDPPVPNGKRMF